jgi:hypothetical protein
MSEGSCYAVSISCPNINDFTGYVKVNYPSGTPLGTVIFTSGAFGTALYEYAFTYGSTTVTTVLNGSFVVAQIAWGEPFANQPLGWETGPGGIRAVACRYATMAQWIYTNIHLANAASPFCATGNSAGSAQIALAMTHYGLGSIFAMVEPTAGPPFARQDWGCDCLQAPATNPCGRTNTFCLGGNSQFIDAAYPAPYCSQEVATHNTDYDAIFLHDSALAPDAVLSYPHTFVKFLYGGQDGTTASNQGFSWQKAITTSTAGECVADAPHSMANVLDAAQKIASDLLTYCKIQPDPARQSTSAPRR